jgi:hypothetical protein
MLPAVARSQLVHGERVRRHGMDDRICVDAVARGATPPRSDHTERRR